MQAVRDWDLYAGVPLGALIERRSLRQIDFAPARPALIRRAVGRAPAGSADMERIGTPAKGLPALEWLLWQAPLKLATPECAYAVQVAADIDREATQLQRDADAAAAREATPEEATAAFAELLNQWVGSSERLRWADLDKPRREAASRGEKDTPPAWPRALSGQTSAAWAAHWQALARLAAMAGSAAPAPGAVLVTLEAYLRGRGLIALADRWAARVAATGAAVDAIDPARPATLDQAVRELTQTKRLAEDEVAAALDVRMGFSDADGD